jgi:hypothetical protein
MRLAPFTFLPPAFSFNFPAFSPFAFHLSLITFHLFPLSFTFTTSPLVTPINPINQLSIQPLLL